MGSRGATRLSGRVGEWGSGSAGAPTQLAHSPILPFAHSAPLPRCPVARLHSPRRGGVLAKFILILPVLAVFTSLVIDMGAAIERKQALSDACDAAALGGGPELP